VGELDASKEWIVYCSVGRRAYGATLVLHHHGLRARNLSGGFTTWSAATEQQDNWDTWKSAPAAARALPSPQDKEEVAVSENARYRLSCAGMQCPGPILAVYQQMQQMRPGDTLDVTATDPGFTRDIGAWSEQTGNALQSVAEKDGYIHAVLIKGAPRAAQIAGQALSRAKTMIVFSGDLDHALAAFIIANGTAAAGQPMTMFFTFWGLNILRRDRGVPVRKTLVERMFGWMMPRGAKALKLSRLNMGGLGTAMMKGVMQSKRIDSLPTLIQSARHAGVRLIACQMTMEMMGIKFEELVDGVEVGGVATMLNEVDKGNGVFFV
jgi:peroxiredoxin family protein/TusA-related sulfurtransferase